MLISMKQEFQVDDVDQINIAKHNDTQQSNFLSKRVSGIISVLTSEYLRLQSQEKIEISLSQMIINI